MARELESSYDEYEFMFDTDVPNRLIHQYIGDDNTRTLVFRNNESTSRKLSILELLPPYAESQIVHPVDNVAEQLDDDFMDIQPLIPTTKSKEKVVESSSPSKNRTKQHLHVPWGDNIAILLNVVRVGHKDEKVHDRESQYHKPEVSSNVPPQQVNLSGETNQNANDGVQNMEELTELHDQNLDSDINKDKPNHVADIQFDQREHIRSTDKPITTEKCKYNPVNRYKYTIVDCLFTTRIAWIWDKYAEAESVSSAAKEEDLVCEYINGYGCMLSYHGTQ
ncbi:hypothetical protein HAX54_031578 [Datura stramonium]|uniref:Uncharacterized protein n=1 Tax=Datura stramonium TaxID=4076 RepID=A0ABS8RPK1_DATST|nr:hypothetical protein [Datura stramonium]